jgi:hypothetical protein
MTRQRAETRKMRHKFAMTIVKHSMEIMSANEKAVVSLSLLTTYSIQCTPTQLNISSAGCFHRLVYSRVLYQESRSVNGLLIKFLTEDSQ